MGFWLSLIVYAICILLAIITFLIWRGPPESPAHTPDRSTPYPPEMAVIPPGFDYRSTFYTDFYEKASCWLHKDGKSVIVLMDPEGGWSGKEEEDFREKRNWAAIKLGMVYEHLNGDENPRIVRYAGQLEGGHLVLEKLSPGPLQQIRLPKHIDPMIRALYYRWALQALSAVSFLHSHGILTKGFGYKNIWLRSDFSIALTGFVNSLIDGKQPPEFGDHDQGCWVGDYDWNYDDEYFGSTPREDLYYWAIWVFELLTPGSFECVKTPVPFYERHQTFDAWKAENQALRRKMLVDLDHDPLGPILWKAWSSEYHNAEEVAEDVRKCAARVGLKVVEQDEIDVGKPWEEAFEIVWTGEKSRKYLLRSRS